MPVFMISIRESMSQSVNGKLPLEIIYRCTPRDAARVAAALLAAVPPDPGLPSQSTYLQISVTPTVKEMIEALGRAIGRPIDGRFDMSRLQTNSGPMQ